MKRMVPGTSESPILSPKVGVTENSSWLLRPTVVNDCSRYLHDTTLLIYLIYQISDPVTSIVISTYLPIVIEPHVSMAVL